MKKYRPYFTLSELKTLRDFSHAHSPTSQLTLYLDRYILDIDSGYRKPNNVSEDPMAVKLGFEPKEPATAYDRIIRSRYLNGLMSPEEEKDYETKHGRSI